MKVTTLTPMFAAKLRPVVRADWESLLCGCILWVMRAHLIGALFALASPLTAQTATDSSCRVKLDAPTPDSQIVQLGFRVIPFDSVERITPLYASLIARGIAQFARVPTPLPLGVYQSMLKGAWPIAKGAYRVTLQRDGHFTAARTVGGTRTAGLDDAILRAIAALDTSAMLPPPDSTNLGAADSVLLSVFVNPIRFMSTTSKPVATPPVSDGGFVPFLRLLVPIRAGDGGPWGKTNNPAPRYPDAMRQQKMSGETLVEFVVKTDSTIDPTSIQVVRASAIPFVQAVLDAVPNFRFYPLRVEGCPVPALAQDAVHVFGVTVAAQSPRSLSG